MKKNVLLKEVYEKNPNFILKEEKDGGILLNPETEDFAVINKTGCLIWKKIDGKNSVEDVVKKVSKKFNVLEREIEKDVISFIKELDKNGLIKKFYIPSSVCFAITGRCNLRCKHCLAQDTWSSTDMPTEKMLDIIDQMGKAGVKDVALFGGEPLSREDIFILIDRLKKYSIAISVNTNASLIDEKNIEEFKKRNVRNFTVSLDGATEKTHDKQRGEGSFERTINGIKLLVSNGMNVLLSFIVTNINKDEIEKVAELGKKLGVNTVRYNHVFYTGNALCYEKEVYIPPKEEKKICERVFKLYKKYGDFITGSYLQQYDKLKEVGKIDPEKNKITVPPCGAANGKFAIRPDGWVTPCEIIWEVKAGNLNEQSLVEIFRSSKIIKEFRRVKYINLDSTPDCKDCEYQFVCFQGHRCYPFHYPNGIKDKRFYCYKKF